MLKKLKNIITWIVFSPRCLLCKTETFDDNSLCATCWSKLSFIGPDICLKCGIPYLDSKSCSCKQSNDHYTKIRSTLVYDEQSNKLIYDFKYNDNLQAKNTISKLMLLAGEELIKEATIIAPVPMYTAKLRQRKFNQALVLAREIASYSKLKIIPDLLIKYKDTPSQSGLSQKLRKVNVKGAFVLNRKYKQQLKDKVVLVIDDVITTGSTINECAKELKINGARKVFALSFARTLKD